MHLSATDKADVEDEANDAAKRDKLLELAKISIANTADHGHTSPTNDTTMNDTVITFTNGTSNTSDDAVVMVLEDYAAGLTFADFVVEVM